MVNHILDAWQDAISILTLDMKAVKAASKKGIANSLTVFCFVALITAAAAGFRDGSGGNIITAFVSAFLGLLIMSFVWFGILWGVARLAGGKADFLNHYKPLADTLLLHALFPFALFLGLGVVNVLLTLWGVWCRINAVGVLHGFNRKKAALVVLGPLVALLILASILEAAGIPVTGFISQYVLPGM